MIGAFASQFGKARRVVPTKSQALVSAQTTIVHIQHETDLITLVKRAVVYNISSMNENLRIWCYVWNETQIFMWINPSKTTI